MTATQHSTLKTQHCSEKAPLVVIVGPTAVGKSRVGILVAQALRTEILTADSRQVYRGMDIGMDKPAPAERQGVPHRLIDLVEPDQPFNVGMFRRAAMTEIARLQRAGRLPLVVGGTGLYVRALLRGLWEGPGADWDLRERLAAEARDQGPEHLYRALSKVDPATASRLHPHDQVKIIRALEVHHLSGRPQSAAHEEHGFGEQAFTPLLIGLTRERAALYRRIEDRVEEQLAKGLVEETRTLLGRGYGRGLGSMKGLGYRQISAYLSGECAYDEAVRRLKRDTRHFAKRQLTWFRKEPGLLWLPIAERESTEQVAERVLQHIDAFLATIGQRPAAAGCPA